MESHVWVCVARAIHTAALSRRRWSIASLLIFVVAFLGPGAQWALADATKKGLGPGVAVPAWAADRPVHFIPAHRLSKGKDQIVMPSNQRGENCTNLSGNACSVPLHLSSEGGEVQLEPHIFLIFWGSEWKYGPLETSLRSLFDDISNPFVKSTYQGILWQYHNVQGAHPSTVINYQTSWVDESVYAPKNLENKLLEEEVRKAISARGWGPTNHNDQFIVFPAVEATYQEPWIRNQGCGWHATISDGGEEAVWGFVPFAGSKQLNYESNKIGYTCDNFKPEWGGYETQAAATHEYAEGLTDPQFNGRYAWVDSEDWEVGDLCENWPAEELLNEQGQGTGTWAQLLWSNNEWVGSGYTNGCVIKDPPEPLEPAPSVETGAATEIKTTQATVNGSVNPNETETHYYFQYGPTTSYGSTTPEVYVGYGSTSVAANAVVADLESGTTYHYRLVARNAGGTSYGQDQTVQALMFDRPSATVIMSSGRQDVYFRGSNGAIWQWDNYEGKWYLHELGGLAEGAPIAVVNQSSLRQDVYFRGSNGAIWQWDNYEGKWYLHELGGMATGDPSAAVVDSKGRQDVYFRGSNGAIWQWDDYEEKWYLHELGGSAARDPSVPVVDSTGRQDVYFRGTNGAIWQWDNYEGKWYLHELGGSAASDPSAVVYLKTGRQDVYFRGTDGAIWQWDNYEGKWYLHELGMSATGDPSAAVVDSKGRQSVFFRGANNTIWVWDDYEEKWYLHEEPGHAASDLSTPVVDATGRQDVYFGGINDAVWQLDDYLGTWYLFELGGAVG